VNSHPGEEVPNYFQYEYKNHEYDVKYNENSKIQRLK